MKRASVPFLCLWTCLKWTNTSSILCSNSVLCSSHTALLYVMTSLFCLCSRQIYNEPAALSKQPDYYRLIKKNKKKLFYICLAIWHNTRMTELTFFCLTFAAAAAVNWNKPSKTIHKWVGFPNLLLFFSSHWAHWFSNFSGKVWPSNQSAKVPPNLQV